MKTRLIGAIALLLTTPWGQACPLKVVSGSGGTLSLVQSAKAAPAYVYAAVVKGDGALTRLDDILNLGSPLESVNANTKRYAIPRYVPTGRLYLVTSPRKLEVHDKFLVNTQGEGDPAIKDSLVRGMSNYGGPLPQAAVFTSDVATPADVSVCAAPIDTRDKGSLAVRQLP